MATNELRVKVIEEVLWSTVTSFQQTFHLLTGLLSFVCNHDLRLLSGLRNGSERRRSCDGGRRSDGAWRERRDEMRWDEMRRSKKKSLRIYISPGSTWLSLFLLTSSGRLNSNAEGWSLLAGDCFKDSRGGRKDVGDGEIGFRDNDVSVLCLGDYKGERKERRGRSQWRSREEASSFCSRLHSAVTTGWSNGRGWKLGCSDSTSRFVNDLGETLSWDVSSEAVV